MGVPTLEREQTVTLELHAAGSDGEQIAGTVDQMDLEVEAALAVDQTLGGIALFIQRGESSIEWTDDQDTLYAARTTPYVVHWRADFGTPDLPEVD